MPVGVDGVRELGAADTAALRELVAADPVANIFLDSQLGSRGIVAGTGRILGHVDGGRLTAACWAGANVVPVGATADVAEPLADALVALRRRFSSIFGPADSVLPLWDAIKGRSPHPFDVRPDQPLLAVGPDVPVRGPGLVRLAGQEDFDVVLPASVDMFTEEVGYSPLQAGEQSYRERVRGFIAAGQCLIHRDRDGDIVFKADLGTISAHASQIQGVWVNPRHRGQGLAAGFMADVVTLARRRAPVVSLYVNDFNTRARAVYEHVGFTPVGRFATVLF
ncbi:GNAT family N-acetyltransferase [Tersicoccus sp. MR15.9]|uniref:GNAT family N-acetyltransferase n=1 Tax=Tersicoccus mangrovi TaxID=3121635 RepID=UPI002FE69289